MSCTDDAQNIRSSILRTMIPDRLLITLVIVAGVIICLTCDTEQEIKAKKAKLVKKHLKRLKKVEGAIKLVGGREEYEGREIN